MLFVHSVKTRELLTRDLERAGLHRGSNLVVHSSLKSIGRMEHGAETLLEAIQDVIGPSANLLVPTFTYSLSGWKSEPFDVSGTISRTGAFTEYVRKRRDAIRSVHPTHSVAVVGPDAAQITADHLDATPLGVGSPFYRMYERDATILMLGTRQDTNSSLHLCEVLAGMPYINIGFSEGMDYELAWMLNRARQVEFFPIREIPGCSRGFVRIEPELIRMSVLEKALVGNAECQVLRMRPLVRATRECLQRDPTMLLCDIPNCAICPKRRRFMKKL